MFRCRYFCLYRCFTHTKRSELLRLTWKRWQRGLCCHLRLFVIFVILALFSKEDIYKLLNTCVLGGGYGPGSYYFWVYIQFAFLLRWAYPFLERHNVKTLAIVFIIISLLIDMICSIIHMPEQLYRSLALRYVFLILLGYLWVKQGIVLNKRTIALAVCSILATLFFSYTNFDLEPFFHYRMEDSSLALLLLYCNTIYCGSKAHIQQGLKT